MAVLGLRSVYSPERGLIYCKPGIDPIAERQSFEKANLMSKEPKVHYTGGKWKMMEMGYHVSSPDWISKLVLFFRKLANT